MAITDGRVSNLWKEASFEETQVLLGRNPGTLPPRTGTRTDSPTPVLPGSATGSGRSWDSRSGCGVGAGVRCGPRPPDPPPYLGSSRHQGPSWMVAAQAQTEPMVGCAGEQKGGEVMRCPRMQLGKMCLPLEFKNSESEWSKPGGLRWRGPGALQPHCKVQMAREHSRTKAH